MSKPFGAFLQIPVLSADPAGSPPAGTTWLYFKSTDGFLYQKTSGGVASKVDTAAVADWSNITNKPATFTPSAHAHAAADVTSGRLADARMPERLGNRGNVNNFGGDWNLAVMPGIYSSDSALNPPPGGPWFLVNVETHDDSVGNQWVTQTAHAFSAGGEGEQDTMMWRRSANAGTPTSWSAWYRLRISEQEQVANHNVKRYVYTSLPGARPTVPTGVYIEWVGPQDPAALSINGDSWWPTA